VVWLCRDDVSGNVNGRDFLVSGSLIGLYSLPEIVSKIDNTSGNAVWTQENLDKLVPVNLTGDLKNMWPRKEEKPA
jgi:hypothetical protein